MNPATDLVAPIMGTYKRWPVEFVSGDRATLVDTDGRSYTDLVAGIAVASLGHAHPAIAAAVYDQMTRLVHVSNLYATGPQNDLAARLSELTGGMHSFFCNSGAEAIECALKLARKWAGMNRGPNATRIVAAEGSFHGRTFGALSVTGQPTKRAAFEPVVPDIVHVPFGDAAALRAAVGEDVAAVLLEPIQGEAGVVVPPDGYLPEVRAACDAAGVLLMLDEIQTGLGRTGDWFAHHAEGIRPDVITLAKALGGGLPIGACLALPEVAAAFEPGDHASTFGGGPVQCRAALATLDVIAADDLVARSARLGEATMTRLSHSLGKRAVVRGRGLMIGIGFPDPIAHQIAANALAAGVLVNDATPHVVRLVPPLVIGEDELDDALSTLEGVVDAF
ncbi:MAG TPA: acetylornithine transaminase [Actinomycetota bacterium]|nr:acetylornithine transaminase [Actinomycetota bacterium]